MSKYRIYELAKEFHTESKVVLNILARNNYKVANHMSSVGDAEKALLARTFSTKPSEAPKQAAPAAPKQEAPKQAMNAITTGRIRQTVPIVQIGRIMSRAMAMAMPIAIIPIMQGTVVRQMQIMRSRIGIQQLQVLLAILLVMPAMLEIVITQASIASSHLPTEKIIMHRGIA